MLVLKASCLYARSQIICWKKICLFLVKHSKQEGALPEYESSLRQTHLPSLQRSHLIKMQLCYIKFIEINYIHYICFTHFMITDSFW